MVTPISGSFFVSVTKPVTDIFCAKIPMELIHKKMNMIFFLRFNGILFFILSFF